MYEGDRGSPRSLPGTSKTAVSSPLVYDVIEDGTVYDMGSYIDDSVRHRLTVCMSLLHVSCTWFYGSKMHKLESGIDVPISLNLY